MKIVVSLPRVRKITSFQVHLSLFTNFCFTCQRQVFNGVLFSKETCNKIIILCLDYYVLIMMLRLRWKNLKAGKISDIKVKHRAFCCFFLVQTFKVVFANKTVNFSKHYLLEGFIKFFLNVCIQMPVMKNDRYIQIYKYLYNFISSEAYPFTAYAGITHRTFSENQSEQTYKTISMLHIYKT